MYYLKRIFTGIVLIIGGLLSTGCANGTYYDADDGYVESRIVRTYDYHYYPTYYRHYPYYYRYYYHGSPYYYNRYYYQYGW